MTAKRILSLLMTVTFVACATLLSGCAQGETYPSAGRVVRIDYDEDVVSVVDGNGEAWEWRGVEDYDIDDNVAMIMSNNGTPKDVHDDIIVGIKYSSL